MAVLGALILPFPAAASPSRAEQGWERMWDGLFAWLGFGEEDGGFLVTGWSSSSIDPLGGQVPTAVSPEDPGSSSSVDPNGEDQ
ncbi:MAG TPA: hypothetical protein VJ885_09915 [Thermoanaerobaculia bacterium]|nr:hypothetical protein [Thermoanaerobaculia bacterium]